MTVATALAHPSQPEEPYQQARALTQFCAAANLDQAPYADTWAAIDDAARAADAAGLTVPSLPEE